MKLLSPLLLLLLAPLPLQAQDRPNILLIIADDLGVDPLNGYHEANLKAVTPTLDSLRAAGITFTNAAASPVCSPTRAVIMTGKFGVKNGVLGVPGNLETNQGSIFDALADSTENAYADALIGKWHLTSPLEVEDPLTFGPDSYDGFLRGGVDDYYGWSRVQNGTAALATEYVTTALSNAAGTWIEDQTQPWFLWLAHAAPHTPYHVPPDGTYSINNPTNNSQRYIAMIEALDFETGRLLGGLSPEVRANTLIIFVGDNGTPGNVMQDYPDGHGKGSLYQGGCRVPLIVSGKGVTRAGEREDALVHVTDLHATILEAAGSQVQGGVFNSLSFYPLLSGNAEARDTRDYNYVEIQNNMNPDRSGYAIRDARYKLIEFGNGVQEFYDLVADSFEVNNLPIELLPADLAAVHADLEAEAATIRSGWSCRDYIQNGDETGIDCGTDACGACTTGVTNNAPQIDVLLYPNPASDYFVVDALGERIESVRLFDLNGRLILQQPGRGMRLLEVHLIGLKPGAYLAEINAEAGGTKVMRTVVR